MESPELSFRILRVMIICEVRSASSSCYASVKKILQREKQSLEIFAGIDEYLRRQNVEDIL